MYKSVADRCVDTYCRYTQSKFECIYFFCAITMNCDAAAIRLNLGYFGQLGKRECTMMNCNQFTVQSLSVLHF